MAVAEGQADRLGGEVEVAVPVGVPEPAAFPARDRDRVELRLDGPAVDDVGAVVGQDVVYRVRQDVILASEAMRLLLTPRKTRSIFRG